MICTFTSYLEQMNIATHNNFSTMNGHIFVVDNEGEIWEIESRKRVRIVGILAVDYEKGRWYAKDGHSCAWNDEINSWHSTERSSFAPFIEFPLTTLEKVIGEKYTP